MTDQEAEVLTERLTRIWNVEETGLIYEAFDHAFFGRLSGGVKFYCMFVPGTDVLHPHTITILPPKGRVGLDYLDGKIYEGEQPSEQEFAQEWLPLFRRNCWLSGADIEASAHEKMEWMRGFSREEIEAWNLKI